jgi:hypothetical protein
MYVKVLKSGDWKSQPVDQPGLYLHVKLHKT